MKTRCYKNISELITLKEAHAKDGRCLRPDDLSIIKNGSIIFNDNKILWVGKSNEIPTHFQIDITKDCSHLVITPEIVDAHTHLVFAGDRAEEYVQKLNGVSYEEIAKNGGGILATTNSTTKTAKSDLLAIAKSRIETIHSYGVGAIEIKSGYALTFEKELELSEIINELKNYFKNKVQIHNTFMAAHAVPRQYATSSEYLDDVVLKLLTELAHKKIIDSVDIFHEVDYFTNNDVEKLFKASQNLNIPVRMHADEFNDNNGAFLATKFNALSADHLLKISDNGIKALANSNTVATLLPGTAFFLGKPLAPARRLLDAGAKVAIASDYNPGSCHCDNIILLTTLCAKSFSMNICELLAAITLNAAHAINLKNQGAIIEEMAPRFSAFRASSLNNIFYNWGKNLSEPLP